MKPIIRLLLCLVLSVSSALREAHAAEGARPNIVYILCDDLGYGDVHCLNPERGKIATPRIDRLAAQGMTFTDAHSSSSVCTPSRYGILTGRYNWRSRLQAGVLEPYGKSLIARDRLTVPALLKKNGYATACIGKWHLGWEWPRDGKMLDFTRPILEGPTTRGFDTYFGTDVPNYPPYCFIENDHTVGIPTEPLPAKLLGHNLASKGGPALPGWKLEAILPAITDKACDFIRQQAKSGTAFFLYLPLTSPHTPLAVTEEWLGKSGLNRYADYVMETDAMIGRVLDAVEQSGAAGNTLVILTSDNGCAPYIGVKDLEAKGHFPSAGLRGYKADIFDGGHRIPFIVRWPERVKAGGHSGQTICLTDLMATCAEILGAKLPDNAGEDSVSILPALLGTDQAPLRESVVHHSINGSFAIRQGHWKLELCADSGGWSDPKPGSKEAKGLPDTQLYDLTADLAESRNVYGEHPDVVARMTKALEQIIADGRSTPGAKQSNDVAIQLRKPVTRAAGE
ncbi:Cerebroside-sulfatase [Chthoniobacter flavus Ellin428]|uniref:Cerebroside-sulfatase n=1 Tax=Chthoniobacter flavus Ellin428 TaxID=497964 RepID=B4DCK7_9BACT|nr:arylsulfatase [Chthoniobacter flavus]EDY15821.1 Cerebroside-sulfatase [Chthoniobacter flavus Ellin428]TCO81862.1 arylsulfatase A-like enzyme [Chthoniobacter flavus]